MEFKGLVFTEMTASLTTAGNYNDRAKSWLLNSLVIFTLTFFLLLPCHVLAQVTFPAQTVGTSNQENPTIAHTSPAGTNTLLVVTTSGREDNNYLSWVRWNGSEELTLLISHDDGHNLASIWYLINPTSGNHDITSSGGIVEWWSVKTFHGVDQTNPFDSPADTNINQGEGPNPSVGIITTADNMTTEVVTFKEENAQTDPTNGGSVEDSDSWPEIEPHVATSHTDLSGGITVGWQDTDGTKWVIIVADILAAANLPNLDIVKRAYWLDGTVIPTGATIPSGVEFKYLLYINNANVARTDISVRDVLDPAFQYQLGTIQVDNSVVECAAATCTVGEEAAIFTAVDGATVLTDALADDVVSYVAPNIDAGDENAGNLQLDIIADSVWAILFSVKMP